MEKYIPKIGLEIHAELKTKTKMFCDSLNDPNEKHPNVNICPVCVGYPGVLPVINKEAVKSVLKTGLSLGGELADYCQFDRKNYFYPDLPKGYQISQYKFPLVKGGSLNGVRLTRIHLEEDTGRLVHQKDCSLVDFNRAGVPLMELVTEPDIKSAAEARTFAEGLQLLLRYLEVSDADMEKGQMRVEVNLSLSKTEKLGTKVEIKNLNSFKAVEQAIAHEIERQAEVLTEGKTVIQETRGWDDGRQKTFSQRTKEEAHDYRYFPEPDLPPLKIKEVEEFQNLEAFLPELPWQKTERFNHEYALKADVIRILISEKKLADFFENIISEIKADLKEKFLKEHAELTVNYLVSDLSGLMKGKCLNMDDLRITPEDFADLMCMIIAGKISSRVAKDILKEMIETAAEPHVIVQEKGLEQVNDDNFITEIARKIIETNPKAAEDYKKGKENALQFLVGMVMKETKGKSNPQKTREILEKLLKQE